MRLPPPRHAFGAKLVGMTHEQPVPRTRAQRGRALFVGESSIDVATARNAGIAVWALPYGYRIGEPIEACQPNRVIPDLFALLADWTEAAA